MRDPDRVAPMLKLLGEAWEQFPDWRLGQLLVNALRPTSPVPEVFYVEDDERRTGEVRRDLLGARPPGRVQE